jgi:pyridoxine kinase
MGRILVLSSQVAYGAIGLKGTLPPLQQAGFDPVPLPTVLLSNNPGHKPGHKYVAGRPVDPALLDAMVDALEANGKLNEFDAVFTGYLPSAEHVDVARRTIDRLRALKPGILTVCDPIFGDDGEGIYIDQSAAVAIRERLIPAADAITPNRFELSWLTGKDVQTIDDAIAAARQLAPPLIAATSVPADERTLANVLVSGPEIVVAEVEKHSHAPHGTGDLFAGILTAELLRHASNAAALAQAAGGVAHAIAVSAGCDELQVSRMTWTQGFRPAPVRVIA